MHARATRLKRKLTLALFGVAVALSMPVRALSAEVSIARQAVLILRILSYDRNLEARAPKLVTVAVAYRAGDEKSEVCRRTMTSALEEVAKTTTVSGRPVRVVAAALGSSDELLARLEEHQATAVYVCPELASRIGEISAMARRRSVLSVSGSPAFVTSGLSIGLTVRDEKTTILVNLAASRAEGVQFVPAFMRIAESVR